MGSTFSGIISALAAGVLCLVTSDAVSVWIDPYIPAEILFGWINRTLVVQICSYVVGFLLSFIIVYVVLWCLGYKRQTIVKKTTEATI